MARIAIATVGTHGDVRPSIGLAMALRDAGHQVVLCAPPDEEKWITSYGFRFFPIGCDMRSLINSVNKYNGHPIKLLKVINSVMRDMLNNQFSGLSEATKDIDLIIGSGEVFAAPAIAESRGIPYCYVNLLMQFLESAYHPPTLVPWQKLPKLLNRFFWKLTHSVLNMSLRNIINQNRRELGLGIIKDVYRYMMDSNNILIAVDQLLFPAPPDLKHYLQIGLWHVPELNDTDLEPGLVKFLEEGPPPVYIGFGSMGDPKPHETMKIIEETVNLTGIRVLISKGWANLCKNLSSKNFYMIEFTPHTKLFPKVAAIVHHGGVGTVFAAAWAGIPQVIVPHLLDHYYQGAHLYERKLIPKPISRSQLTSKKLAQAIKTAISDPEIIKKNAAVGEELRKADKIVLRKAVDYVEQLL
jgi:UDP:flavonoid glycosyltransferase YjiC (YdhE family)